MLEHLESVDLLNSGSRSVGGVALPIGRGGGKLTPPRKRKGGRRARCISSSPQLVAPISCI